MAGITDTGFERPTYDEIVDDLREEFETEEGSGVSPSYARGTVLGAITVAFALLLSTLWASLQAVYDSLRPSNATGRNLDTVCELVGITRRRATNSTAGLVVEGVGGTVIPSGSYIEDIAGNRWRTLDTTTISGTFVTTVNVECTETGAITAPAGTITSIVSPITGWTSATNQADATPGQDDETDNELRLRRLTALSSGTSQTLAAIRQAVESVGEVDRALVIENRTNTSTVVSGPLTIPSRAFAVFVYPSALSAAAEGELAQAIYDRAPAGIQIVGLESENATDVNGNNFSVAFSYSIAVAVTVDVEVELASGYALADVEANVETAVQDVIGELGPGDDVRLLAMYGAISAVEGVLGASVEIQGFAQDLAVDETSYAIPGTVTVTLPP